MNLKTTLVLVILLVVVGAFFWFVERESPPGDTPVAPTAPTAGKAVFDQDDIPSDQVQSITIERNGKTVVFAKEDGDWYQTKPLRFPLNNWSVDDVASELGRLVYFERFKAGAQGLPSLSDVKLDPPQAVVTIEYKDKPTRTIRLGRKDLSRRGYLSLGDDGDVYLVNDGLHAQVLDKEPNQFRKRSLTVTTESQASRVTLTHSGDTIDLVKSDGNWSLGPPHTGRAGADKVSQIISAITSVYIDEFVADQPQDLATYGLDEPAYTVKVIQSVPASDEDDDKDGDSPAPEPKVNTLLIGAPADLQKEKYFATFAQRDGVGDTVFTINKSAVEKFNKSADDMRDPRITPLKSSDVNEIEIKREEGGFKLVKSAAGWDFAEPGPGYSADDAQAAALLSSIVDAQADSFRAAPAPDQTPVMTITLAAIGKPEPDVLRVFPAEDDKHPVYRNQETIGYLVPKDKLASAFKPALALRDREVIDLPRAAAQSVTIKRPDGVELQFSREPLPPAEGEAEATSQPKLGPWKLAGFDTFESGAFDSLLEKLLPLRAQGWFAEPLSAGERTFTVKIGTHTLTIDADSRRAALAGVEPTFEVSKDLVERLDAEFRPRTLIDLAVDDIASVAVTRGESTITVTKNAEGDYVAEGGGELDQSAAGALFDSLSGLRAQRYVAAPSESGKAAVIAVTDKDGNTITLSLSEDRTGTIVPPRNNGLNAFTLEQATFDKLVAKLTGEAEDDAEKAEE